MLRNPPSVHEPRRRRPLASHLSHRGDRMGCDFVLVRGGGGGAEGGAEGDDAGAAVAAVAAPPRPRVLSHGLRGSLAEIESGAWPSDHLILAVTLARPSAAAAATAAAAEAAAGGAGDAAVGAPDTTRPR